MEFDMTIEELIYFKFFTNNKDPFIEYTYVN